MRPSPVTAVSLLALAVTAVWLHRRGWVDYFAADGRQLSLPAVAAAERELTAAVEELVRIS